MKSTHSILGCLLLSWFWFSAPAQNKLNGYEYWFNNNYAAREIVSIVPSSEHLLSQDMDVATLPDGVNLFNIRYKNEEGFYSTTLSKLFYKAPPVPAEGNKLVGYEFWFNTDFTTRQQVGIAPATEHQLSESLDVANLPDGVNLFNIRYKDSGGQFSTTLSKLFYKAPAISDANNKLVSYEYWFNKDFLNRQQVSITSANEHLLIQSLDASTLPDGVNLLHIRHKDSRGQYSTILSRMFLKKTASPVTDNKLVAYKYWIDGNAEEADTTILPSATDLVFVDTSITLSDQLAGGDHTIAFQFKDLNNTWSVPYETSFFKEYEPRGSILASESYSCPGTSVSFTSETIDVDAISWDFGDGESSSDFDPMHAYVSPGEYTVTATISHITSGKSDEISLAHTIVVHPTYSTTDELTLCAGELPYQFGSQSLMASGEYTETFVSSTGCDSTVTLTLNVNPSYEVFYAENGQGINLQVNDDFEADAVGSLAGWIKLYNGTGDANQKVINTLAKNGVQSFQLEGASSWAAEYYKTITGSPDRLVVEAWINVEKTLSGLTGSIGLADKSVGSWGTRTSRLQFYNGRISATYMGGETYDIQPYTPGKWYHIKMDQDLVNLTYSVFIDGVKVIGNSGSGAIDAFPMHPTVQSKEVILCAGNSGTVKLYFDDVKMYEPSTVEICASELPFILGTQQLMRSGEYTETFQTVAGCDSIVHLSLQVNPVYEEVVEQTVFDNELPYLFGALSLEQAGEYSQTFTSSAGCDSTVNLTLIVKSSDFTEPTVVCNPIEVFLNSSGEYALTTTDILALSNGTSDNRDSYEELAVSVEPNTFDCQQAGQQVTVTITATDQNNNTGSCQTTVTVTDNQAPEFTPVTTITVTAEEGTCFGQISYPVIEATDVCGTPVLARTEGLGPNAQFPVGTTTERWTATDASGNVATLSLDVIVNPNPAAPSFNGLTDQIIDEDASPIQIPLSGVADGNGCADDPMLFTLSSTNEQLIQSWEVAHTTGETTGTLSMVLSPNANGESALTLTVTNEATGKHSSQTFNLQVNAVNDAPALVQTLSNLDKTTRDKFMAKFSSEIGTVFNDADEGDRLTVSIKKSDGSDLPAWLIFRNDSLISNIDLVKTGCLELTLKAVDQAGAEATATFNLCITFPVGMDDLTDKNAVKVYPNPTRGEVFVELPGHPQAGTIITVVDITGKTIKQQKTDHGGKIPVDLTQVKNGIYFIRTDTNGEQTIHKIVVSH
ncbi:MAG: T9SS type A sorting domain-containing protein [Mangrovibacterium sp.]